MRRKAISRHLAVLVILVVFLPASADTPSAAPFTSPAAVAACNTYTATLDRLQKAFDDQRAVAAKTYAAALDAAGKKATQAGDLDEALRIRNAKRELEQDLPAVRVDLAKQVAGSVWRIQNGLSIAYFADGTIRCNGWQERWPGRWKVLGPNTIEQREPGGHTIHITFDPTVKAALWVYQDQVQLWTATRIESTNGNH